MQLLSTLTLQCVAAGLLSFPPVSPLQMSPWLATFIPYPPVRTTSCIWDLTSLFQSWQRFVSWLLCLPVRNFSSLWSLNSEDLATYPRITGWVSWHASFNPLQITGNVESGHLVVKSIHDSCLPSLCAQGGVQRLLNLQFLLKAVNQFMIINFLKLSRRARIRSASTARFLTLTSTFHLLHLYCFLITLLWVMFTRWLWRRQVWYVSVFWGHLLSQLKGRMWPH